MALGKFPEAIYDFTWALKLETDLKKNDQTALSKYNRFAGNCYFEMSQYAEALTHYTQALQKDDSGINNFNKGLALSKLGQLKSANKCLNLAREKFGTDK